MKKIALIIIIVSIFNSCTKEGNSISTSNSSVNSSGSGKSGSLANLVLVDNYIYHLKSNILDVFKINNNGTSQLINSISFSNVQLEAGFFTTEHPNHFFIGTPSGMLIINITDKERPYLQSVYTHITGCDPVTVKGNTAYVTIRSGSNCRSTTWSNLLETIDISDKNNPRIIHSNILSSPWGLAHDNNLLVVCENQNGVNLFNISNPQYTTMTSSYKDIKAKDVILNNHIAMFIGDDALYQYSYNNQFNLTFLSQIPVVK